MLWLLQMPLRIAMTVTDMRTAPMVFAEGSRSRDGHRLDEGLLINIIHMETLK